MPVKAAAVSAGILPGERITAGRVCTPAIVRTNMRNELPRDVPSGRVNIAGGPRPFAPRGEDCCGGETGNQHADPVAPTERAGSAAMNVSILPLDCRGFAVDKILAASVTQE